MTKVQAHASAHSNIALIKYWGKSDTQRNLPAVPSLSLTLDGMKTETVVAFDPCLPIDRILLDGRELIGRPRERVIRLLDTVRGISGISSHASVESRNDFPTASGLASSASGFAALAMAATHAAGLRPSPSEVSALARAQSASAARSVFGGFSVLRRDAESAVPLPGAEGWPLRMLVAVTTVEPKAIGSTAAMELCRKTSPYYEAWVHQSDNLFAQALVAVDQRNLSALGTLMEKSTLMMHASMLSASPAIIYLKPSTLALVDCVQSLRQQGAQAYFTMDAGPHVKVLVESKEARAVAEVLARVPGVERIIDSGPGPAASVAVSDEVSS